MKVSKTTLSVVGLFLFFAALVSGALLWSGKHYQKGEGLHESLSEGVLLQLHTRANSELQVDLQPVVQAERVLFGQGSQIRLALENLSDQPKRFRLRAEMNDPSFEAFDWKEVIGIERSLAPKEKKEIALPFVLNKDKVKSGDGTLTLRFFLEAI